MAKTLQQILTDLTLANNFNMHNLSNAVLTSFKNALTAENAPEGTDIARMLDRVNIAIDSRTRKGIVK